MFELKRQILGMLFIWEDEILLINITSYVMFYTVVSYTQGRAMIEGAKRMKEPSD